jgi:hypothetical protein
MRSIAVISLKARTVDTAGYILSSPQPAGKSNDGRPFCSFPPLTFTLTFHLCAYEGFRFFIVRDGDTDWSPCLACLCSGETCRE